MRFQGLCCPPFSSAPKRLRRFSGLNFNLCTVFLITQRDRADTVLLILEEQSKSTGTSKEARTTDMLMPPVHRELLCLRRDAATQAYKMPTVAAEKGEEKAFVNMHSVPRWVRDDAR
jgi:hypothetical protein